MYLKSITVKGFKSFAKRTELEFQPGISMVVGPNGSGKSNITDAVQWVLGEQSPSSLRGSAMQDVIFAGSLNHKALGLAEVSLTLDNSDKSLALDFSEVTVTRRISRSGENFYSINSTPCRLLDIYELLHDSGLGRQTHSIIGQGKLEEIISSKPEEKRVLLEEAAGVLKHKKRKERALRKLISTEDNLKRAKDILREINQQIKPLEEQVSKAKTFKELNSRLKDLEIALIVKKISNIKKKAEALERNEDGLQVELSAVDTQVRSLNNQIKREEEKYQKHADEIAYQHSLKDRLTSTNGAFENILNLQKHKALSLRKNINEVKEQFASSENQLNLKVAQVKNLEEQINHTQIEIKRNLKSIALKRKENEDTSPDFQNLSEKLEKEEKALREINEQIKIKEAESLEKANQLYFSQKEADKQKQQLEKIEGELSNFLQELKGLKAGKKERVPHLEAAEKRLAKTSTQIEAVKDNINKIVLRLNEEITEIKGLTSANKIISSLNKEKYKLLQNLTDLNQSFQQLSDDLEKFNIEINVEGKENLLKQLIAQKNQAMEEATSAINNAEITAAKLKREKIRLNSKLDDLTLKMLSIEKNIESLKAQHQIFQQQKQSAHLASAELNYQSKNLNHQILALKNQLKDNLDQQDELDKQRRKCLQKIKQADSGILLSSRLIPLIDALKSVSENIRSKLKEQQQNISAFNLLKKLREEEKQLSERQKGIELRKQQFAIEKNNLKNNLDNLVDVVINEHNLAVETAIQNYAHTDSNQNLISTVKQQLKEIGPVNAVAEEHFSDLETRRTFLDKQIEDLLRGKSSINKIIKAIDYKIKESLLYAFQEISQNFKQLFSRLFPGGQAELLLTGDNIFESGLDVQAQPYGKSLKKLSLLSGGETALTALALLFAVYHTRPSPFYILDEVEAALDDINLQRFIRLLKEMKTNTQFIIITHQRRTMEVADCLYGITMQADGVTKVVSQKLLSSDKNTDEEVKEELSVS